MSIISQVWGRLRALVSEVPTEKGDLACDVTTGEWSIFRAAAARVLEDKGNKGNANGYAELNGSGYVPPAQLGSGSGGATKFLREDSTFQTVSGGSLADGTYGDVTVSGGGTVMAVTDLTITSEARGDLLSRGASSWNRLAAGTAGEVLQTGGAGADPSWRATSSTTTYDTAGTYSLDIPAWATSVRFRLQGGGGGGAAGGRRGAGVATQGGGGGNSGYYCEWECDVADLTGPLEVIVGVGGTGAPGISVDGDATVTGGSAGGDTSIRNNNGAGNVICVAQGGALPVGRTAATVAQLAEEGWLSNQGGAGTTGTANGAAGVATSLVKTPGSGGGGGGLSTGNTPSNGGRGGKGGQGLDYDGSTNGQLGGTAPANPGVDAVASAGRRGSGGPGGGAGGAGDGSSNGGRGGDGIRGTGGGGGGGARGAATSGRGGNGGAGWALITFT